MAEQIRLAVREIVEFLLQSGSIDNRFGGGDRALLGARLHRMLQKREGPGYQAEVTLSIQIAHGGRDYLLEGRADGLFEQDGLWVVDEIKTVGAPLELVGPDYNDAHWGQALCYAHMLASAEGLDQVAVRLTYCQADTGEIKRFWREERADRLEHFVHALLEDYQKWAQLREDWAQARDRSIRALDFPFASYRRGQRELAVAAYRTIERRGRLFCQAPTGIGKTVSTLFPAVKAMGQGLAERIFYLTAKTITRQVAEEAFAQLRAGGLRMKTVTLTAKDKICFLAERDCNPEACPYAEGYYDRVRDCVYQLLQTRDALTREAVEQAARERRICPFELSLDLSTWCDAVICDYNYLFDPVAYLQRFFGDKSGEYVFLVDEAHNLLDRARDMYSAQLDKAEVLALKKELGKGAGNIGRGLRELNSQMVRLRKACGQQDFAVRDKPDEAFCQAVGQFSLAASEWLEQHRERSPRRERVLKLFWEAGFFLRILELYDGHYRTVTAVKNGGVTVRLLCLDPSSLLDARMSKGRAAVLFSATLSPMDYYREVLGGGKEAKCLALRSPFPQDRLCLLAAGNVSVKYRDREASAGPIADLLHAMVSARQGNYLAYFPSYRYLLQVYEAFCQRHPEVETTVQTGDMDEGERVAFLQRFGAERASTLLGFCVLGGVFAEGVDLKGDRLIGVAVVGVGLPQIGPELDLLRAYYDEKNGMGFAYAYRYPGMNKVLQAVGRVIRGPEDRGVALLIDSRFPSGEYQRLFPAHWSHWEHVGGTEDLSRRLVAFWEDR